MLPEPPVIWMPKAGSLYWSPAGASAPRIWLQSASRSSAISIGSAVCTPWPNSRRLICTVTVLSGAMCRKAFGSYTLAGGCCALAKRPPAGRKNPNTRPPPATAPAFMKPRRDMPLLAAGDAAGTILS